MKRYDMTTEYNRYACEDQVTAVESADGAWVKFEDHQAALAAHQQQQEKASAPVDLSKLTRYFPSTAFPGKLFEDKSGTVFKIADVEQLIAAPAAPVAEQGAPDYSEMSREALERHAARMAQALANDRSRQFYDKHATGPMMPLSCLCCGQLPDKVAIRHAELPGIVVCETCRAAIAAAQQLVDEHGELPPIPVGICFSEQHCNFYRADTGQDMGNEFYDKWRDRADEFPDRATARAALAKKGGAA